jgi:hypothetical protein
MLDATYQEATNKVIIELSSTKIDIIATRTERIFQSGDVFINIEFDEEDKFLRFSIFPSEFISESAKYALPYRP